MNPLNQTEEKREAVPNGVSRVGIAALGVLLQVLWIWFCRAGSWGMAARSSGVA